MARRLTMMVAAAAFFVFAVSAATSAEGTLELRVVSQTSTTITLGWDPQPGYGYLFSRNGVLVSRTNDPARSSVRFTKGDSYEVAVIVKGATGTYPPPVTGDTQPPSAPSSLTAPTVTQTAVSLLWGDATDNVGVTNYRIYRGATLLGQGPGTSGGFTNTWTDTGRTCGTAYLYGVEAQDEAGNTGPKATLTVTTAACSPPPVAVCSDGIDNDSDGKIDYPADPGCASATDTDEADASPPGTTITLSQLVARASVNGAVIDNVTVTGSGTGSVTGANVTLRNSRLSGFVLDIEGNGFRMTGTNITNGGWNIWGADDVLIENGVFDGAGRVSSNQMWDSPAGDGPERITIRNSTFKDYRGSSCTVHGEALFVGGYSRDVLIEGNTFTNNGCTSHIFFSYWGTGAYQGTPASQTIPHNVCVRGNTFGPRFLNTYVDINFRDEIVAAGPAATNIKVQPGTATTNPEFNAVC